MHPKRISACHFPTKVIFIDDNPKFLNSTKLQLVTDTATYRFFDNPTQALHFLQSYQADPFTSRCLLQTEDDDFDRREMSVDISKIHEEIYNPKRFDQISVVVIDYAMPGMNGAELIQELHDRLYKVVLLTGEANHTNAVELFNKGTINYFVRKDDLDATKLLKEAISRLQHEYLEKLSEVIISSITQKAELFNQLPSCLDDPVFIDFFHNLLQKHQITEYYLYDEFGSFLLLDSAGNTSWLLVLNDNEMEGTEFEMNLESDKINRTLLQAINNREVLRYCFNPNEYPEPEAMAEEGNLFYPATRLKGKTNYYYSYIQKPYMDPQIDISQIVSYDAYRDNLESN